MHRSEFSLELYFFLYSCYKKRRTVVWNGVVRVKKPRQKSVYKWRNRSTSEETTSKISLLYKWRDRSTSEETTSKISLRVKRPPRRDSFFTRRLVSDTVTIKKAGAQTGSEVTNLCPCSNEISSSGRGWISEFRQSGVGSGLECLRRRMIHDEENEKNGNRM